MSTPHRAEHHLVVPRTARFYTVGELAPATDDLWIVCHGYGQLAASFIETFEVVAAPRRVIVAPEGLSRFYLDRNRSAADPNPAVGATWMTREDREHEIEDHVRYLDALVDHVRARVATDRVRLRVLGFSQGVATVGRWIERGRVRVNDLVLWAGSFPTDVDLTVAAGRLANVPVTVVVGTRDQLASWAAADAQVARFTAAGITARLVQFDGGHRLDDDTLRMLADA